MDMSKDIRKECSTWYDNKVEEVSKKLVVGKFEITFWRST